MRMFTKKMIAVLLCLSMGMVLFAEPKSTGVTDSDVKNWAKNLNSIAGELSKMDVWDGETINASAKQKNDVVKVLQKYGISGSNCIEKFSMISKSASVVIAESEIDEQSAALLKKMGMDPFAELKKDINSKDYAVVKSNSKAVVKAWENLDLSSFTAEVEEEADASLDEYYAELSKQSGNMLQMIAQPSIDEYNSRSAKIKNAYEQLCKVKGNDGNIYKSSGNAGKYKKASPDSSVNILFRIGDVLDNEYDNENDAPVGMEGTINLKKKTVEVNAQWKEASFDETAARNGYVKVDVVSKKQKFTVKSIEYYGFGLDGKKKADEEGEEYIITTKEGPVFHFWTETNNVKDVNKKETKIKGVDTGDWYWWLKR
ncbi:MAG: hypothetical protein J6W60_06505 [Treponema sp.]|nr:hypothetical protein [Treponema sp.]